jgi:glycosyltransferase involved in cell wall biosynthesis
MIHWIASGEATEKTWFHRAKTLARGLRDRAWALAHLIEQNGIDLVYTNTVTCIDGALAAKMTNRPHIWHLREQVRGNSQLRTVVPEFLLPWVINALSTRVLVNSHYLYRAFAYYPLREKLTVVYNGIDPERFDINHEKASYTLRSELNLPLNSKVVAIIGSIIPRKGQLLFVNSASHLVSSIPDVAFLVVGEGPPDYVQLVKNRVQEHGLKMNFHFVGSRNDIPKILAGVDLLVIAADEEPFGRTVIEAMAAGVPVVSTKCGGPEEIILDGITGLLVSTDNPIEAANAIERILNDPEFASNLIKAGKDRLNNLFTLRAYTDNVQSVLESVNHSHHSFTT